MAKIRKLSDVMPGRLRDSVKERRRSRLNGIADTYRHDDELLKRCEQAWNNKEDIRRIRERVLNYVYGDQWGDVIEWRNGQITERRKIQLGGDVALQNNVMISIQNSVVGLYAKQGTEPVTFARAHDAQWLSDMMSATMQANWQDTKMPDKLKAAFEEYLDGGVAIARETYEERNGLKEAWTDFVNPNYAFWESGSDVTMTDLRLIGVLHDVAPGQLYRQFCNARYGWTVDDINKVFYIEDADSHRYYRSSGLQQNEQDRLDFISFDRPSDETLCRLIEVWTKESKTRYQCYDPIATNADDVEYRVEVDDIAYVQQENQKRMEQCMEVGMPKEEWPLIEYELIEDEYWFYTYMATDGTVLASGETPYDFRSHPFTIKLYPYINSEVHPFMANIIDQQRYINRLITMHDKATRYAVKQYTLFPIENMPAGMSRQDIADELTEYDGLLFYRTNTKAPNLRPETIGNGNQVQVGTQELLNMQLSLIRDISNVSGALQGKTPSAGTSAARYAQESYNATTSLYTLLADFTSFAESIADKKCMMIKQFYPDGRLVINKDNTGMIEYDRMSARDVMFKISVKEAAATASFQTQVNDTALQLLELGAINVKQYLSSINLPFADSLLQSIESDEAAALAQQQMMAQAGAVDPNVQQALTPNTAAA